MSNIGDAMLTISNIEIPPNHKARIYTDNWTDIWKYQHCLDTYTEKIKNVSMFLYTPFTNTKCGYFQMPVRSSRQIPAPKPKKNTVTCLKVDIKQVNSNNCLYSYMVHRQVLQCHYEVHPKDVCTTFNQAPLGKLTFVHIHINISSLRDIFFFSVEF